MDCRRQERSAYCPSSKHAQWEHRNPTAECDQLGNPVLMCCFCLMLNNNKRFRNISLQPTDNPPATPAPAPKMVTSADASCFVARCASHTQEAAAPLSRSVKDRVQGRSAEAPPNGHLPRPLTSLPSNCGACLLLASQPLPAPTHAGVLTGAHNLLRFPQASKAEGSV
jgi:hypothetical protein